MRFASLEYGGRRVRVAAVAGASVAATLFVQQLLHALASVLSVLSVVPDASEYPGSALGAVGTGLVFTALPFGLGVFLSLARFAPIAAELRMLHVVTRALLAAAVGAAATLVVTLLGTLAVTFPQWFPADAPPVGDLFLHTGVSAIAGALDGFVAGAPVAVLAGVLVWIWLARHPAPNVLHPAPDKV